jgi:hypothetical protein
VAAARDGKAGAAAARVARGGGSVGGRSGVWAYSRGRRSSCACAAATPGLACTPPPAVHAQAVPPPHPAPNPNSTPTPTPTPTHPQVSFDEDPTTDGAMAAVSDPKLRRLVSHGRESE